MVLKGPNNMKKIGFDFSRSSTLSYGPLKVKGSFFRKMFKLYSKIIECKEIWYFVKKTGYFGPTKPIFTLTYIAKYNFKTHFLGNLKKIAKWYFQSFFKHIRKLFSLK